MSNINQNSTIESYETALIPTSNMVDARNGKDRLSFLVDFASLINFYDKSNQVNGNWQPFLLKDPVFLVAYISKTPFKKLHSLYVISYQDLNAAINRTPISQTDLSLPINKIFDQIIEVYRLIEYWTQYMQQSSLEYNLKSYVISQLETTYAAIFWATLSFREYLTIYPGICGITPENMSNYDSYDQKIWKESKGKEPFWEVLGLFSSDGDKTFQEYVEANTITTDEECIEDSTKSLKGFTKTFLKEIYTSLKNAGDQSYTFLNSIVDYASVEYDEVFLKKDNFPDTVLMRTFVDLMDIYKNQANTLSKKHLDFYYHDILKQTKEYAKPDSVFASASLSFDDGTFVLPKATLFNAGEDENAENILFESLKDTSLNPANITSVYTLSQAKNKNERDCLFLKEIENVGEVKKDENEKIVSWETFGSQLDISPLSPMSFVVASPMLFLQEAKSRIITLKFTFEEEVEVSSFENVKYFFSTEEEWLSVTPVENVSILVEIIKTLEEVVGTVVKVVEAILKVFWEAIEKVYEVLQKIVEFLEDLLEKIASKLEGIIKNVSENIRKKFNNIVEGLSKLFKDFIALKTFKDLDKSIKTIVNSLSNAVRDFVYFIFNGLNDEATTVFEELIKIVTDVFGEIKEFGKEIHQSLKKIFEKLGDKNVRTYLDQLIEKFTSYLSSLFEGVEALLHKKLESSESTSEFPEDSTFLPPPKYDKTLELQFLLEASDPAIIPFVENPDGISSTWPMFKMEFFEFENLQSPPQIEKLSIAVNVEETTSLVLSNDFGALDPKKPFQLYGAIADKNQSFYLGSNEIFSKPVTKLDYKLQWDNLPENGFEDYYGQYNEYLKGGFNKIPESCDSILPWSGSEKKGLIPILFELLKNVLSFLFSKTKIAEKRKDAQKDIPNPNAKFQFTNESFTVDFGQLSNNSWNPFKQSFSTNTLYELEERLIFIEELIEDVPVIIPIVKQELSNESNYKCGEDDNTVPINSNPSPSLQEVPLEFSETTTNGFMKMELTSEYGFGMSIYPPIVSKIALYNADIIGKSISDDNYTCSPTSPPNLPYVATTGTIGTNYNAFYEYDLTQQTSGYPIECYYYTPFNKYKIYDNKEGIELKGTTIGTPLEEIEIVNPPVPLYPAFEALGQLFIPMQNLLAPNNINFYFELSRNYTGGNTSQKKIYYSYLGSEGWEEINPISDGTNNISCSGIITLNIPSEITNTYITFPEEGQWISIAVKDSPDNYSQTSFFKTNGFELTRTGDNYLEDTQIPQIEAETITDPEEGIPEIESLIQPFPSFGGKSMETSIHMNRRVSTRLKTKDRIITPQDYYRTIRLNFSDIYFSKVVYDTTTDITKVLLINKVDDWKEVNAFLPVVSDCKELEILSYLEERTSGLVSLNVSNFEITYVKVTADVYINAGYSKAGVFNEISNDINLFLSPWIKSRQQQIEINQGLDISQIESFIKEYDSVYEIENASFQLGIKDSTTGNIIYGNSISQIGMNSNETVDGFSDCSLLVPSLDNQSIKIKL